MIDKPILLKLFKEGDQFAFRVIFKMHIDEVKVFVKHKWTGDVAEREEIVSDCFCDLWKRRHKVMEFRDIIRFLMRQAHCQMVDRYRIANANKRRDFLKNYIYLAKSFDDPTVYNEMDDFRILLRTAIGKMPPKRKLVMQLSFYDGFNCDEIAKILKLSVQTVLNQRNSGVNSLRLLYSAGETSQKIFIK